MQRREQGMGMRDPAASPRDDRMNTLRTSLGLVETSLRVARETKQPHSTVVIEQMTINQYYNGEKERAKATVYCGCAIGFLLALVAFLLCLQLKPKAIMWHMQARKDEQDHPSMMATVTRYSYETMKEFIYWSLSWVHRDPHENK